MSFEKLPVYSPKNPAPTPARIGMQKFKRERAKMKIVITGRWLRKLGDVSGSYEILRGRGEDEHLLQIRRAETGAFRARALGPASGNQSYKFIIGVVDDWPDRNIALEEAQIEHHKTTNSLRLSLPSWAWLRGKTGRGNGP